MAGKRSLMKILEAGERILCAEGYLLALSRRGYISHGVWVPEFLLQDPEPLRSVHYEMAHAGSDVMEAFQYYTHREKMKQIGREDDLERINKVALQIAQNIANEKQLLFAGGICNTNVYIEGKTENDVRKMLDEQVKWSKEAGVDYIIGETFSHLGEAQIALDVIKSYDLPAVITFGVRACKGDIKTLDNVPIGQACKSLLDNGATVVGSNCFRGPQMMLEVIKEIVKVCPPAQVCALPIAYRTTKQEPSFFDLTDSQCPDNNPVYPRGMEPFCISPVEITNFTKQCLKLGLQYMGICCGNSGELTRAMAIAMGKNPSANKYYNPSNFGIPSGIKDNLKKN